MQWELITFFLFAILLLALIPGLPVLLEMNYYRAVPGIAAREPAGFLQLTADQPPADALARALAALLKHESTVSYFDPEAGVVILRLHRTWQDSRYVRLQASAERPGGCALTLHVGRYFLPGHATRNAEPLLAEIRGALESGSGPA